MSTIEEIMKEDVITVTPRNSVRDVILQLGKHRVSGLCVVDELEHKHILGVITEWDLLRAFKEGRTAEKVSEIMCRNVQVVSPQASLDDLFDLFLNNHIRRIFVSEDGILKGVISRRDLLYAAQCREQTRSFATCAH